MKKRALFIFLMVYFSLTSFAQEDKFILRLPNSQEFSLPKQSAHRIAGGKWKIREDKIDSTRKNNDTIQIYINRGEAVLLNNNGLHPDLFVWEIPIQRFHTGQKLMITSHSLTPKVNTIVLHLDWVSYEFKVENKNRFAYNSRSPKPTPTSEEIISKRIPIRRDSHSNTNK